MLLVGTLLVGAAVRPVSAQVTLGFYPDTVRVGLGYSARAFLAIENRGTPIRAVRLDFLTSDSIQIGVQEPVPANVAAQQTLATAAVVTGRPRGNDDVAFVRVSYTTADGVRKVVHAALHLAARTPPPIDSVLAVEIMTSLAALSDEQTGVAHLLVKNKSAYPVHIDSAGVTAPSFIEPDSALKKLSGLTIAGRANAVIPISVKAKKRVAPGKHTLLFRTYAHWTGPDGAMSGALVLPREITIGVTGESEILQALALPSFLLLPGFLMLVAFGFLWGLLNKPIDLTKDPKRPEFWLISITLSLLWVKLYPWFGGHSLLHEYGLGDVVVVWMWSVGLGLFAAVALSSGLHWRARARTPTVNDDVPTILRKLHRRHVNDLHLRRVDVTDDKGTRQVFRLMENPGNGQTWVAPPALYEWKSKNPKIHEDLEQALQSGNLVRIADCISELRRSGQLDVYFAGKKQPELVDPAKVKDVAVAMFLSEKVEGT